MIKTAMKKYGYSFTENDSIGVIMNHFSEQLFTKEFNLETLPSDNFLEVIEKNKIDIVFIEPIIYETDHPWYSKNFKALIKFLELLNVKVVCVKNYRDIVPEEFNSIFSITIKDDIKVIKEESNEILIPLLANELTFNPIENEAKLDVLYFKFGKIDHYQDNLKLHRLFNPRYEELDTPEITKTFLIKLIKEIKNSKIIYIYYSKDIDITFVRYLELIAVLQNTLVFIDPLYEEEFKYAIKLDSTKTAMQYMSSYINNKIFLDKAIIPKTREAFLDNTFINSTKTNEESDKSINISVISSTMRKDNIFELISRINNQKQVNVELILLTHGFILTSDEKQAIEDKSNFKIKFLEKDQSTSFGMCLNECVLHAEYDYVTKMDDDDFYYENYLIDSWIALEYSNASLVGKTAFFYYLENENITAQKRIRSSYRYAKLLKGNTLFSTRETMKKYMFSDLSRHVDSDLIERILNNEELIYGFHPYDMCVFRGGDRSSHTYKASDGNFLLDSKILFYGSPNDTITT